MLLATACGGDQARLAGTAQVTPFEPPDAGQVETDAATSPDETSTSAANGMTHCKITPQWLEPHKQCSMDADCETVAYRSSCCPTQQLVGVSRADADLVQACADEAPTPCNQSMCLGHPDRTEDGRAVQADFSNVAVHCVQNTCQTTVTTRPCGKDLNCNADEVCVVYENVPGSPPAVPGTGANAGYSYACRQNSCGDKRLDCTCAHALCDSLQDVLRRCAVDLTDAAEGDVYCGWLRQ
jgi:hypothetical protein